MPKTAGTDWMSTKDASMYLGVTLRTLYRMIDIDGLPAYQMGRVIRLRARVRRAAPHQARHAPAPLPANQRDHFH
jgi:excisionase family DNA binding protein